jgi:5-methyltetrahydrofolate--homocysteine methyltransferase
MLDRRSFAERLKIEILVLDGGLGTLLQDRGVLRGGAPEELNLSDPGAVEAAHGAYVEAGAQVILTNSFGGNRAKLREFGLADRVLEINRAAVELARRAAGDRTLVAASVGPTGRTMGGTDGLRFDETYAIFREQADALAVAGPDLVIVETMSDLREIRAALLALRDAFSGPLLAQMTFLQSGRSFTGTDPGTFLAAMEGLDIDGVGANCSVGPEGLRPVMEVLAEETALPLIVEPNAGLPVLEGERTVYPGSPETLAEHGLHFARLGVNLIGGCCGTGPEHIRLLRRALEGVRPVSRPGRKVFCLSSGRRCLVLGEDAPFVVIGERINPTGRKALSREIDAGKVGRIVKEALRQVRAGAQVLDINVAVPAGDEAAAMARAVEAVQGVVDVPLSLDSADPVVLERGLQAAEGRCLLNSVTGEERRLEAVLPLAKRYGAAVIALLLAEDRIPESAEERLAIARRILERAEKHGLRREDLLIDCVTLTLGSDPFQVAETLKAVAMVKGELALRTVLGVSNVSFGLPERGILNAAFLSQAMTRGLDAAILNPLDSGVMGVMRATAAILGGDRGVRAYMAAYTGATERGPAEGGEATALKPGTPTTIPPPGIPGAAPRSGVPTTTPPPGTSEAASEDAIFWAVLEGNREEIGKLVAKRLREGEDPLRLAEESLVAALREAGRRFERGSLFLPQVILCAEALQEGFREVRKVLPAESRGTGEKIVMATVRGDIHDIGKNLVSALLRNVGYEVVDLGKNVGADAIYQRAVDEKADMVGLSALMTTTMMEMKRVIELFRERGSEIPVIVGGAVVTRQFAERIGAAGYAGDAVAALNLVDRLFGKS